MTVAVAALAVTAVVATAGTAAAALGMGVGMMMGCSATVATTVTTVATAGAYLVAGTIGAMAVSDSIEIATSDAAGNGYNPIRDDLLGGNQEAYDTVRIVTDVIADSIVEVGGSYHSTNLSNSNKSEPQLNFQNEAKLLDHYRRHSPEWGEAFSDSNQYLNAANNLLNRTGSHIHQFTSSQGWLFKYDSLQNEFLLISDQGTISTFFRPTEGMEYWLEQIDMYGG